MKVYRGYYFNVEYNENLQLFYADVDGMRLYASSEIELRQHVIDTIKITIMLENESAKGPTRLQD